MSRVSFIVFVVALAVYCASSVPIEDSARVCTVPGQVWNECPDYCKTKCPEAIPEDTDCSAHLCEARCACKDGYVESKEGLCIFPQMCEIELAFKSV